MTNWTEMSAADLGRGIAKGDIDPVDLTEHFLNAISAHPMRDRIYARLTPDRALAEAEAAKVRAGHRLRRHPLDGVPISWKDLYDTVGTVTEAGTALLKGRVPDHDARVLQTATQNGLVCLGKTHLAELAFSGLGLNPVTETSPCVNDLEAVAGGSSSGAAASVAFGLAPAGVGSDTGGSVRLPACWNDLVGLKTTSGRLSLEGVVPLISSLDTVGPLCRTVEDAALMLSALEGKPAPDLAGADLRGRRFAALQTIMMDDLDEIPARAYAGSLDKLRAAGASVELLDAPEIEQPHLDSAMLYTSEAWAQWGKEIEAQPQVMFAPIRERFETGAGHKACDFVAAWKNVFAMRAIWAERIAGYDAVVYPTAPNLPEKVETLMALGEVFAKANLRTLRNTRIGNLIGGAIVTLPTGVPSCGISFMAGPMAEHRLLRIAAAAEMALR